MKLISLVFLSLGLGLSSIVSADTTDVLVDEQGLVSISAEDATVEELMNALGQELNVTVTYPSPVTDRVSVNFQELPIEKAIQEITTGYILLNSNSASHGIKEIIVMPEGESSAYLPEEGELKQLLSQDGGASAALLVEDEERKANRLKMLKRIAEIKSRTQIEVEEARLAIELEEEFGEGIPTPVEMD